MIVHHMTHNGEPKPRSSCAPTAGSVDPVETLKDAVDIALGYSNTFIAHRNIDRFFERRHANGDLVALFAVLHCIVDEI